MMSQFCYVTWRLFVGFLEFAYEEDVNEWIKNLLHRESAIIEEFLNIFSFKNTQIPVAKLTNIS